MAYFPLDEVEPFTAGLQVRERIEDTIDQLVKVIVDYEANMSEDPYPDDINHPLELWFVDPVHQSLFGGLVTLIKFLEHHHPTDTADNDSPDMLGVLDDIAERDPDHHKARKLILDGAARYLWC